MKQVSRVLALAYLVLLSSEQAFSIFDAQLLVGQRKTNIKGDTEDSSVTASEVQLSLHLDPIPLVPVSLGVYYTMHDYAAAKDDEVLPFEDLKGSQAGIEVMAWSPIDLANLTPYAKLGYTAWGEYNGSNDNYSTTNRKLEATYNTTGYKLGVGLKWSPIAIVEGLLEVDYVNETWKVDSFTLDNEELDAGNSDGKATALSFLVGVSAGI